MPCFEIPSISYGEFDKRVKDAAAGRQHPVSMILEMTYRCNVRCIHCYVPQAAHPPELSTAELKRVLDEAADLGVMFLLISGGEPLIRTDFSEIWVHAKRLGLIITLFTNATLLTDEVADLLDKYPPAVVEVTVHSMRPDVFEAVSGVPGSFERCMEGIERLRQREVGLRIKSVALRQNAEWIPEVDEYARSIGAHYRFDVAIVPRLDTDAEPLQTRLDPESVVALDMSVPGRIENLVALSEMSPPTEYSHVLNCGGGRAGFSVNPYGMMSICPFVQYAAHDWRNGSLAEGWSEFIPEFRAREQRTANPCPTCELMYLCHRCPAKSYLEMGDEEAPIPYWCEVAARRKRALDALAQGTGAVSAAGRV